MCFTSCGRGRLEGVWGEVSNGNERRIKWQQIEIQNGGKPVLRGLEMEIELDLCSFDIRAERTKLPARNL